MNNKWLSRKFLMACGVIIITIALGIGYEFDPKLVALLTTSESALWIVIEGIVDAVRANRER
jgi:hypothetical protein